MAQDKRIEAYRRRLLRRGYDQVSISLKPGRVVYRVAAVEPLAGVRVWRDMTIQQMEVWR